MYNTVPTALSSLRGCHKWSPGKSKFDFKVSDSQFEPASANHLNSPFPSFQIPDRPTELQFLFPLSVGCAKCTISVECASVSLRGRTTRTRGIRDVKHRFEIGIRKRHLILYFLTGGEERDVSDQEDSQVTYLVIRPTSGLSTKASAAKAHMATEGGERE